LALDPKYVEGCLERIGEDDPHGETLLRDLWEEREREVVLDLVKSGCEIRPGRPPS
jgi:hypothetical protein